MREIIFRGKTEKGEWVYGDLLHPDLYGNGYSIEDFTKGKNNCFDVIPETVGQYTGLRDCKRTEEYPEGQKIFEGDIIRENYGYGAYDDFCVVFCLGGFNMIYIQTNKGKYAWYGENGEVVGNIHDNPELIGGDSDA